MPALLRSVGGDALMELRWPVVDLGEWRISPEDLEELGEGLASELLSRHQAGDWGDVNGEDWERNDQALEEGDLLVSAYTFGAGRVLIATERDRSYTRVWSANRLRL